MTACAGNSERVGDLSCSLFDQHDLVPDRFWKKIERLDQRLSGREKRGWC